MGERAKSILNEYSARELLKKPGLDFEKFYNSDLKIFIKALKSDNENMQQRLKNADELLESLKLFWEKYSPMDNTMEIRQIENVLKIIRGD